MLRIDKKDIIAILSLFLILITGFFINYGHFGDIIVDCGREAFIPQAMLNGDVLYKDILNWYGPFAYQVNAFLYKIFGSSLNLLYVIGLINTAVIIACVYRLSRFFLAPFMSFCVCFFMVVYNVYSSVTVIHFIFPYSYSYIYALSAFLISLVAFLQFMQSNNKQVFLYLSFFFLGLSFANKAEFILTIIPYALYMITTKPKIDIKNIFISGLMFSIVPILSYSIVFLQGATLGDILGTLKLATILVTTPAYKDFAGINILIIPYSLFFSAIYFAAYIPLYLITIKSFKKQNNLIKTVLFCTVGAILFLIYNCILINITLLSLINQLSIFCWMPISTFLIMSYLVYKLIKEYNQKDLLFLVCTLAIFLSIVKSEFVLAFNTYGNYTIALFVLVHTIFLLNYIPKYKILNKKLMTSIILICFAINSYIVYNARFNFGQKKYSVNTTKGKIYGDLPSIDLTKKMIDYAEKNTDKNDKILVIPEGLMVNYLTNRKSDMKLYALTDVHVQTFGEQRTINMLKKSSPDYIFLHLPLDEGKKIVDYVMNSYVLIKVFTNPNFPKEKYATMVFKAKH